MTVLLVGGGRAAQIEADVSEEAGGVAIERSVSVVASSAAFRHDGLRTATVSPPAPFSVSATFRRGGPATRWRGDLRVDFPGRPDVALTGKGARARLGRARAHDESGRQMRSAQARFTAVASKKRW
jgi:hypothetical protein